MHAYLIINFFFYRKQKMFLYVLFFNNSQGG